MSDTAKRSESKFDNDTITGGDIVYKILGIDASNDARSPNIIINHKSRREIGTSADDMMHDEQRMDVDALKYLLEQEEFRGQDPPITNNRLRHKMRKIKNSSKNMLNKKINSLKLIRPNGPEGAIDEQTLTESHSHSDFTFYQPSSSLLGSTSDVSGGVKHMKRPKPKTAPPNEGVGMTTLLVRSLMAAPSLDSIAENHDLDTTSTARVPSIASVRHTDSLLSLPTTKRPHTQNKLKLSMGDSLIDLKASDSNMSSANASISSCTVSSSSENEEEEDDGSDINDNDVVLIDADTISMVMKSIMAKDEEQLGEGHWIQPSAANTDDSEEENPDVSTIKRIHRIGSADMAAIKTGATRIIRSDSKKKSMETRLVESHPEPEALETMLAAPRDVDEEGWIQPGSTVDDADDNTETESSSLLHDFRENIAERLHNIHLPHHHHGPKSDIKDHHGLLGTAMESMLLEQASLLGAHGASDTAEHSKLAEKRNTSVESFKKFLAHPFRRESNASVDSLAKKPPHAPPIKHKYGLLDSAMKAMALETTHILENVGGHATKDGTTTNEPVAHANVTSHSSRHADPPPSPAPIETDERKGEQISAASPSSSQRSFNTFCDSSICASHVFLTENESSNVPSHTCTNATTTKSNVPTFVLTSDSMPNVSSCCRKPNQSSAGNRNSLSPNRELHSNTSTLTTTTPNTSTSTTTSTSTSTNNCTNCCGSSKLNPLISSSSCDVSMNNKTNKTKMLAPKSNSIHRSGDAIVSSQSKNPLTTTNGETTGATSSAIHNRADSIGAKLPIPSPSKVPTSASYNNTAAASIPANATTSGGSAAHSHGKDGASNENNICRRSSDSDLSVTPKGTWAHHIVLPFYRNWKIDWPIAFALNMFSFYNFETSGGTVSETLSIFFKKFRK